LRTNVVLLLFFLLLDVNLLILTIAEFTRSLTLQKIAGGEGLLFVAVAFYAGAANLLNEENCGFNLPVGNLARG
jgi:succinate-acetate transporter protein